MRIEDLKILKGPNMWSVDVPKLVVLRVSFYDAENPSQRASEILKAALDIQHEAGIDVDFGIVRPTTDPAIYNIVFEYCFAESAEPVAISALAVAKKRLMDPHSSVNDEVEEIEYLCQRHFPGLSTGSLIGAAKRKGIPVMPAEDDMFFVLGYGCNQERFNATITGRTRMLACDVAGHKEDTKKLLNSYSIPVPRGVVIRNEQSMEREIQRLGYPVVIKPLDGNHGRGITTNITNMAQAIDAFRIAKQIGDAIIIEKYITGHDYRLLVINYKFVAAVKRIPAYVKGDGVRTIGQLIEDMNKDPRRKNKPGNILKQITIDELTLKLLTKEGFSLESVPEKDEVVQIKETANVSQGGMPVDVTDEVHPDNVFLAERIAKVMDLDVCGIDILSPDLTVPLYDNNGAVVEVNAAPGIRMHITPAEGKGINVADKIIEMLFPEGKEFLIPIIAVTGTNGKTTTVRLLSKILKASGKIIGNTTTDGIYVNGKLLETGDCSGPRSARYLLKDPTVETVVLECARGGIIREGLGFYQSDIAIVTNITEDHLGLDGVDTLEDLVRVKSVVPKTARPDGYSILNAEDEKCVSIVNDLRSNIAYFSLNPENKVFVENVVNTNGTGATLINGEIVLIVKGERITICREDEIPLTRGGKAKFMTANILPAALAAFLQGVTVKVLVDSLKGFSADADNAPGRLNEFDFGKFRVLVDYAHNAEGLHALGGYIKCDECSKRVGVLSVPGDRRDSDIVRFGEAAATYFDEIIIKNDKDLRGRSEGQIHSLLFQGVSKTRPNLPIHVIPEERDAIEFAVKKAQPDSLITVLTESPFKTLACVTDLQGKYGNGKLKKVSA